MNKTVNRSSLVILLADDNPADRELIHRNLEHLKRKIKLFDVEDGVEVLIYLERKGKYADKSRSPRPDLILLDINMPKLDGKQVLEKIKNNTKFRLIPVVMLTTSNHEKDIFESYNLGVNAYITKPVDIKDFNKVVEKLEQFWLSVVKLPPNAG